LLWSIWALTSWIIGLCMASFVLGYWITKAAWRDRAYVLRSFSRKPAILAMAACDLRLLWIELFLLGPPVTAAAFILVFVAPTVDETLKAQGQAMPDYLSLWSDFAAWSVRWWWLALLIPMIWIGLATRGRTLWLCAQHAPNP